MKHTDLALTTIREAIIAQAQKAIDFNRKVYDTRCEVSRSIAKKLVDNIELTEAATKRLAKAVVNSNHIDRSDYLSKSAMRELKTIDKNQCAATDMHYRHRRDLNALVDQRVDIVMSRICLSEGVAPARAFDVALKHDFNEPIV
jgi:hypothetical protein